MPFRALPRPSMPFHDLRFAFDRLPFTVFITMFTILGLNVITLFLLGAWRGRRRYQHRLRNTMAGGEEGGLHEAEKDVMEIKSLTRDSLKSRAEQGELRSVERRSLARLEVSTQRGSNLRTSNTLCSLFFACPRPLL